MKKTLTILVAILITGTFALEAQNSAGFNFEKTTHSFGRIKEEGGKVAYKFKFKNTGKKPILIKNVQSTCGCTTPEWSKKPVLPGQAGYVSAEYDPNQRPGAFTKQIKVYNNLTTQPIVLEIKGDVIPKTKQVADIYRHKIGALRAKSRHVAFARIYNTEVKTLSTDIINDSDKPVTITFNDKIVPKHLKVVASPKTLAPKQKGKIKITYDASKKNAWGYKPDRLVLILNGESMTRYPLSISATIKEDFSKLSASELASAPTMDFDSKVFNFGTIKQGEKVSHEFKFKNNGKRDLIIRDTKTTCGCTAVETKKVIKPGESSTIKTTFNSSGKLNKQNKSITLITNIPGKDKNNAEKYKVVLRVKGQVVKP